MVIIAAPQPQTAPKQEAPKQDPKKTTKKGSK